MYKVFLVDDEELVIKSLIASVDWGAHGFEVAGYALRGSEAFDHIQAIDPHLVFTDIRMPGISGLELIKQLKDVSSKAFVVVLSGYAEFALAQKAINYGAFGYCLKPFDEIEISGFLKKAAKLIKDKEMTKDADILEYLETGSAEHSERLKRILLASGINPDSDQGMMVVVSLGKSRLNHDGLQRGIAIRIGMRKHAYLLQDNAALRHELEACATAGSEIKGVGVSGTIRRVEDIQKGIQEGELWAYRYFTAGSGIGQPISGNMMSSRYQTLKAVEEAMARKDPYEISDCMDAASLLFAGGHMHIQDALTLFNQIMSYINRGEDQLWEEFIYSFDQLTESFESVQDMLAYLKEMLAVKHKQSRTAGTLPVRNRSFKAILEYINQHYREELSISVLSEQFNVNANYISQLFRKETGTTFTQYITAFRMDYACRLLSETDLPINEIAEQSGYGDYFYFSRMFKRTKGTTPSNYRASTIV
ncbi:helix-turn-helix domain-containing protein [Paenibacillus tarimensis]